MRWVVVTILGLCSLAAARGAPATSPSQDAGAKRVISGSMGLTFAVPAAWRTEDAGPSKDETGAEFRTLRLKDVDSNSTVLAIVRREKPPGGGPDAKAHAKAAVDYHLHAATSHGGKIVVEEDVTVAGAPGRLGELALDVEGKPMRLVVVCFVLRDREYKLTLIGEQDFVRDVRPQFTRLLASIEPAPATGKGTE